VYAKNAGFRDELHKICHHMLTIDEFESAWGELIGKYALQDQHLYYGIYCVVLWNLSMEYIVLYYVGFLH
jgi:hypothetical protein